MKEDTAAILALALALNYLTAAIIGMALLASMSVADDAPLLNVAAPDCPYNLSHSAGHTAYEAVCEELTTKWDGTVDQFPSFAVGLLIHASKICWHTPGPHGITTIDSHNIFTHCSELTTTEFEAAHVACVDDWAIQNPCAMYIAVKKVQHHPGEQKTPSPFSVGCNSSMSDKIPSQDQGN